MSARRPAPADPLRLARRRRWRFGLILAATAAAMVAAAAAGWHYARVSSPPAGPLVLISIDTLRADHLPAYGYREVETPAIDTLAAEGVVFTRAYAHSPLTFPSHVALLSGLLPFESGVRDNAGAGVPPDVRLLPRLLQNRGWVTGGVVSAYVLRRELGLDRGFDFFDSQVPAAPAGTPAVNVARSGEASLEVAERWMDGLSSPRFFLFFHLYEPHAPYEPPAAFARFGAYDGEIAAADAVVGRLFAALKRRGWYDQALIVLVSDHGEGLGDHGEAEHGVFLYDETIRVPLIVRLPGSAKAGGHVATPVQHIDLVPTLLDWLEAPRPAGLRGRSLRGLIDGHDDRADETGFYAESQYSAYHAGWSGLAAFTSGRYRFIRAPHPEFYDLAQDPREQRNLWAESPPPAAAAQEALERLCAGASTRPANLPAEDLERLRALGYAGPSPEPPPPGETALPDPKDRVAALDRYRRAVSLASGHEYDAAVALLKVVVADDPGMRDAWVALGDQLLIEGRPDEAAAAFRHVVDLDPGDPEGLPNVSRALLAGGRTDQAIAHAELGLALVPASERSARMATAVVLVRAAFARGDREEARRQAARAEAEDPTFPLARFVEGRALFEDGKYAEALPRFEQARVALAGQSSSLPGLDYYAGETLRQLGQAEEAEQALRAELRLSPHDVAARVALASLCWTGGRPEEARTTMEDLIRYAPSPEAYKAAVRFWTTAGDRPRADALRTQARKLAARRAPRP